MLKLWKLSDSKTNKLILVKDNCIYKGNPKPDELNKLNSDSSDLAFLNHLFSIPYSYITSIQSQVGKNEIKIYFGNGSEEELIIKDKNTKKEVFDFLKQDIPHFKYSSELPSVLRYAKPQFFALLFMTALFIWSLYLAIQIENGAEYEIIGGGRSITSIVLAIANLGVFKNIIGYIILLGIISISLFGKLKSRSETEFLIRQK